MAESTLSITIRDTNHPCSPYRGTYVQEDFAVQILNCDGTSLIWRGVDYSEWFLLDVKGTEEGGYIHGQIKVPEGSYLIRAMTPLCRNVITDWAYVNVCCNETVCVNLVHPSLHQCISRLLPALELSTFGPQPMDAERKTVKEAMPKQVKTAMEALKEIAEKLPEDVQLPTPPTAAEIRKIAQKHEQKR